MKTPLHKFKIRYDYRITTFPVCQIFFLPYKEKFDLRLTFPNFGKFYWKKSGFHYKMKRVWFDIKKGVK